MGFLLGAFGKLAAGSRYRSLQARMMRVQSRIRTVSRNVANMEKLLDKQKKAELNNAKLQATYAKQLFAQGYMSQNNITFTSEYGSMSDTQKRDLANYQNATTNYNTGIEQQLAQYQSQIEEKYEQLQESMLDPLKDEEDSLQLEKDTLETQVQVAKADYEACQKMEQTDAKNLAPNYTGAA